MEHFVRTQEGVSEVRDFPRVFVEIARTVLSISSATGDSLIEHVDVPGKGIEPRGVITLLGQLLHSSQTSPTVSSTARPVSRPRLRIRERTRAVLEVTCTERLDVSRERGLARTLTRKGLVALGVSLFRVLVG